MSITKINTAAIHVENANVKLAKELLEDSLNYLQGELELRTKIYPPSDQHSEWTKKQKKKWQEMVSTFILNFYHLGLVEVLSNNQEAALDTFKTGKQFAQTKKDLLEDPSKLEKLTALIDSGFVYAESLLQSQKYQKLIKQQQQKLDALQLQTIQESFQEFKEKESLSGIIDNIEKNVSSINPENDFYIGRPATVSNFEQKQT